MDFLYFGQTLMDNHKLVTISFFLKKVCDFYLLENMLGKTFRIWLYSKQNIFLNEFFFLKFQRKISIFNTRSVSYNVSLQHDIMQNC